MRTQDEARQSARARVKQLAETEQQITGEIAEMQKTEAEQLARIRETEARLPEHAEAVRQIEAQAQRQADEEMQRLAELESAREQARMKAEERAEQERKLKAELDALRETEEEQLQRLESVQAVLSAPEDEQPEKLAELESAREQARMKAEEQAEQERLLKAELDALRQAEKEQLERIESLQAELRAQESRQSEIPSEAAVSSDPVVEIIPESELAEVPWLSIDLDSSADQPKKELEVINVDTTADLALFEPEHFGTPALVNTNGSQPQNANETRRSGLNEDDASSAIFERLHSSDSSERAAALADLAQSRHDDSYRMIIKSFDDPSVEVRNAAARALSELGTDLAASFTRALRDASPERRRKIGAAIAGSGLAGNAINSLSGESRDRTYDAFSILFLMAKAGEVQPLMQAISKHSNVEVRLTAIKLLALSNQPQALPAFRNLAAREALPPEVHSAVMEAIYLISNQTREVA